MTAHSVLNVRAAPEWGNSELYNYYERNGLGYGTVHIRRQDRRTVFFFFFLYICILINLKQRPVKITGKNIKSYATAQVHFPWEREGSLTAKSPNLLFKIYYPLLYFTSKLFPNWVLRAKFQRITQILCNSPTQSANSAKFALFD